LLVSVLVLVSVSVLVLVLERARARERLADRGFLEGGRPGRRCCPQRAGKAKAAAGTAALHNTQFTSLPGVRDLLRLAPLPRLPRRGRGFVKCRR
jgi:hypothetical protein